MAYICPMCPTVRSEEPALCPHCGMALESDTVVAETRWICPMHPEVVSDSPGSCPECGMALEPDTAGAAQEESPELRSMWLRFRVCAALSLPLLLLTMGEMLPGVSFGLSPGVSAWVQLVLATPVVLWGGAPFFERALTSLRTRRLNMFTLIGLGTGAAYGTSTVATLAPGLFPESFRLASGEVAVYFEAAAVIVTLVLLGQVLELRARSRTGAAIRALLDLAPKLARRLLPDGGEEEVALRLVVAGDRLRVRPGEAVPVDGVVEDGHAAVDESMVTGESTPVSKGPGDALIGGTVNGRGALVMRAERVGSETLLARIVALVGEAQRSRAPVQRLADSVSAWFVPAVVSVALVAFAAWALVGPEPRLAHALLAAVAVLIVACPCALGLATPMSIMVASGRGASLGVLFRDAEAIERLRSVDTLVVDKTGTLTEGRPAVTAVEAEGAHSGDELLQRAASLEQASEHPLAGAFLDAASERGLELAPPSGFESHSGLGVSGEVDGTPVALGSAALFAARGAAVSPGLERAAGRLRAEGQTAVFVAVGEEVAGVFGISDPVKETTPEALDALRREGLRIVVLTGDAQATADAVAARLGIDEVVAEVLPEDKARVVGELQQAGHVVAMAGDGVNDAPALALADVGIAMGTGTDVAMHSAGVTLVRGDLRGIVRARALSRATLRNIRQNLGFAFGYNALGVPIAAGVLYPVLGILLSPMLAAAAMSLSSVSVIANALRLRRVPLRVR